MRWLPPTAPFYIMPTASVRLSIFPLTSSRADLLQGSTTIKHKLVLRVAHSTHSSHSAVENDPTHVFNSSSQQCHRIPTAGCGGGRTHVGGRVLDRSGSFCPCAGAHEGG